MSTQLVVNDFAQLPELLARAGAFELLPDACPEGGSADNTAQPAASTCTPSLETEPGPDAAGAAPEPNEPETDATAGGDLGRLLEELEAAGAALADLVAKDERDRADALEALDRYDAALAAQAEAVKIRDRAAALREEAERVAGRALTDGVREAAARCAATAAAAEAAADGCVEERRRLAESLAARPDVLRTLEERRRRAEEQRAEAEAAAREQRRSEAIGTALVALESGWTEEARGVVAAALDEHPGDAQLIDLLDAIGAREVAARVALAERELWEARRGYRLHAAETVERLTGLDLRGVPPALKSQVFGMWKRACARLCRASDDGSAVDPPLLYVHGFARGAVLTRESTGDRYAVLSALNMGPRWAPGQVVDQRLAPRVRPLLR